MNDVLLYVDEDAGELAVVQALRARSIDVLTTIEANRSGSDDLSQLAFATSIGRVIYTFNVRDFAKLHKDYMSQNQTHAGIIVIPDQRYAIGEKVRRLADLISRTNAEEMINRLVVL